MPACVTVSVASVSPFIRLPFLNHLYDVPPVAVKIVEPPEHIEAVVGEMVPVGADAEVTVEVFDAGPSQSPW